MNICLCEGDVFKTRELRLNVTRSLYHISSKAEVIVKNRWKWKPCMAIWPHWFSGWFRLGLVGLVTEEDEKIGGPWKCSLEWGSSVCLEGMAWPLGQEGFYFLEAVCPCSPTQRPLVPQATWIRCRNWRSQEAETACAWGARIKLLFLSTPDMLWSLPEVRGTAAVLLWFQPVLWPSFRYLQSVKHTLTSTAPFLW